MKQLLLIFFIMVIYCSGDSFDPAGWGKMRQPVTVYSLPKSWKKPDYGLAAQFIYGGLKFYQKVLHPVTGLDKTCPFYPVCSRFALLSLYRYGPVWAVLMTMDRLFIRENAYIHRMYHTVMIDGHEKYRDPVHENYIFHH